MRLASIHRICLLTLCCSALTQPTWAETYQPVLYVDDSRGQLGKMNLATGEIELIGRMGVTLYDIAFDKKGNLFGVDPSGLWSIDAATAETKFIGGNFTRNSQMNALVFGPDGTLYAAGRDAHLYRVNPNTGHATAIGNMGYSSAGDLAFDRQGRLYLSSTRDSLVQIDLETGQGTEIGLFGFSDVLGLARDENGVMYGYSGQDIFTIDLDTGLGSLLRNYAGTGLTQAYGGSFIREALVPEPGSAAIAISGVLLLLGGVRLGARHFTLSQPTKRKRR